MNSNTIPRRSYEPTRLGTAFLRYATCLSCRPTSTLPKFVAGNGNALSVPKDFKSEILDILKLEHPNQTAKVDSIIQTMVHDLGSEVFSWDKTRLSKHINKILSPSTSRNGRRHKNAQHTGADFSANKTYPRLYPGDRNKCLL